MKTDNSQLKSYFTNMQIWLNWIRVFIQSKEIKQTNLSVIEFFTLISIKVWMTVNDNKASIDFKILFQHWQGDKLSFKAFYLFWGALLPQEAWGRYGCFCSGWECQRLKRASQSSLMCSGLPSDLGQQVVEWWCSLQRAPAGTRMPVGPQAWSLVHLDIAFKI